MVMHWSIYLNNKLGPFNGVGYECNNKTMKIHCDEKIWATLRKWFMSVYLVTHKYNYIV